MLKLNSLISTGAVLQSNQKILISGAGKSNALIELNFRDENYQTYADETGKFLFELPPHGYGESGDLVVTSDKNDRCIILGVKFGEVFLLGGQSNIEFKMSQEKHYELICEANEFDQYDLSYINVPQIEYYDENGTSKPDNAKWQGWLSLNRNTLGDLSAIGYYAVIEWAKKHPHIPVGLVSCNKGGSSITAWLDEESLNSSPLAQAYIVEPYHKALIGKTSEDFESLSRHYREAVETYNPIRDKWVREHPELRLGEIKAIIGNSPWPPPATPNVFTRPSGLYHTMFKNITPYTFKAVLWYQGEEDSLYPDMYAETLPILLKTWRRDLQKNSLPFYIVQLPMYDEKQVKSWAGIRQVQLNTALSNAYNHLIVSADTGDSDNIHPIDKSVIGKRIGEIIEGKYYDNSPYARIIEHRSHQLILDIKNAETIELGKSPLVIKVDEKPASVSIVGKQLVMDIKPDSQVVRYGWGNAPELSLFNEVGYPVSPFEFILSKELE